jgi:hypothetical protein
MKKTKSTLMQAIENSTPANLNNQKEKNKDIRQGDPRGQNPARLLTVPKDEVAKTKRPRSRPSKVPAPDDPQRQSAAGPDHDNSSQQGDILYLNDPMSACRTVLLMKTLTFFLIQEGYNFEIPTE